MTEGLGPNGYTVFDPVGDAIRAAAATARADALEEAAKVADEYASMNWATADGGDYAEAADYLALAIRALKEKTP